MQEIALYALRNVAGLLVQIVPCATLCFLPFVDRIAVGRRRMAAAIAGVLVVALVPFVAVGSLELPAPLAPWRYVLQNVVFLATLAVLLGLYVRGVDAAPQQKVFVFCLVMCYGYFVTQLTDQTGVLLDLDGDGHMYAPTSLAVLLVFNAVGFPLMSRLMGHVRKLLGSPLEPRTWGRMAAVPCAIVAVLYLVTYLPASSNQLSAETMSFLRTLACVLLGVFFMWWMLRAMAEACESSTRAAELRQALVDHERRGRELEAQLAAERERAERLRESAAPERAAQTEDPESPVVLSSPTQAVSVRPADVLFAESLNRARILHLVSGESLQINTSLAQIAGQLPDDRFVYCHRSVVVNLDHVASLTPTEAVLRGGVRIPVSRRRFSELSAALEERRRSRRGRA